MLVRKAAPIKNGAMGIAGSSLMSSAAKAKSRTAQATIMWKSDSRRGCSGENVGRERGMR